MRLYLTLTRNKTIIPFNYQPFLTGAIHKWLGRNNQEHDNISLYSFSWLQDINATSTGINLNNTSHFFISAYNEELIKRLINGITQEPSVCFGSAVSDLQIVETPGFRSAEIFFTASPVFIKRRVDNEEKHITYDNPSSGLYLTETLQKKLKSVGLAADGIVARFDTTYLKASTKIIRYNAISNRVNICPVIIEGAPEQIAFAWEVGVGNSTGIGFGALK